MLYLWRIPENISQKCIGSYHYDGPTDYLLLMKGQKLSATAFNKPPVVSVEASRKRMLALDCIPNSSTGPIVNERVKLLLEQLAPDDVQFFKIKLVCSDGELDSYFFLNVTSTIQGIDYKSSRYKVIPMTDGLICFQYLTYLPDCMGSHYLARDKDFMPHLLVTEEIKKLFDREKITGVRLVRPEDNYGPLREI